MTPVSNAGDTVVNILLSDFLSQSSDKKIKVSKIKMISGLEEGGSSGG